MPKKWRLRQTLFSRAFTTRQLNMQDVPHENVMTIQCRPGRRASGFLKSSRTGEEWAWEAARYVGYGFSFWVRTVRVTASWSCYTHPLNKQGWRLHQDYAQGIQGFARRESVFVFGLCLIAWCTSRRLLSMAPRQRISSNLLLSARTIVLFLFLGAVWVCWKVFVMLSFKRWSMIDYYIMQFFSTVCALVLLRACCFGCLGGAFFSPTEREGRADYSIQSISFDS